jgi:hypothetical protein
VGTSNPTPHIDFGAKSDGEQRKTNDACGNGAAYRDAADHDQQVSSDKHCERDAMLQHDYDLQRGSLLAIAGCYKYAVQNGIVVEARHSIRRDPARSRPLQHRFASRSIFT